MIRPRRVPAPARPFTFPIATGGWNARDALDAMKPDEAETLINWFPETTYCRLRRGYTAHSDTGTGAAVKTLAVWGSDASHLLAASDGEWWDCTSDPAVSVGSGYGSDIWDTVNFNAGGNQYLIAVGGSLAPQVYDGTSMTAAVNTVGGVAPTFGFSRVTIYNSRVYYAQEDTLKVWYLPVGQYQGALTEYDLGTLCHKGGYIAALATWTRDNAAAGANEMFIVVTNMGEVLVFIGDYPGGTWQLSARFDVGEPVAGPNCVVRIGPDMVLLCEDGFQPLAHYLQLGQSQAQAVALSSKIGNAVTAAVNAAKTEEGWGAVLYPAGNAMIFNIPQGSGVFYQYAVNTLTGAWCQWQGMNAHSWTVYETAPYFGGADGVVYQADSGTSDDGANIAAEYRGSYQYIGGEGMLKYVTMAQPVFNTTGPVIVNFGIDVDFNNTTLTSPATSTTNGSVWGTGIWGLATWGSGLTLQRAWVTVGAIGYSIAPHFLVTTNNITLNLMSINLTYSKGGFL